MKFNLVFIMFLAFASCMTIRTRNFVIERQLSRAFYLGKSKEHYHYGVWGRVNPTENYSPVTSEFVFIFKNPDSIVVKSQYIYLQRKNKYCLILDEDRDSLVHFDDIIKTRNRNKINILLEGLE